MDAVQLSLTLDCQQFLLKANNPIFMLQVTCIPVQCCTHEGDKLFWSITFAELDPSVHRNTKCLPFVMNSTPTLFSMGVLFSGNCSSSNSDSIWQRNDASIYAHLSTCMWSYTFLHVKQYTCIHLLVCLMDGCNTSFILCFLASFFRVRCSNAWCVVIKSPFLPG